MSEGMAEPAAESERDDAAPAEGTLIGPYRVVRRIGKGGMGEVLLAYDPRLDRQVAIKRVRPRVSLDEDQRRRLRREARMAARLSHPSITQVHDLLVVGDVEHIVMEYVPGSTLRDLLELGPPPLPEALRIAGRVASGLTHAHAQGVVHRDLKSENVLLRPEGDVKIVDFGLARPETKDREPTLTRPGAIVGTCRTMAPEQALGQSIDARTDLFSFGVLLYELFTGSSPFLARTQVATLQRIVQQRHRSALELMPELPVELAELIDELLEKDPARRPEGGAAEVVARLEESSERLRRRSTDDTDPAYLPPETAETLFPESAQAVSPVAPPRSPSITIERRRLPWIAAAVVLALLLTALAVWWMSRSPDSVPAPVLAGGPESAREVAADPVLVAIDQPTVEPTNDGTAIDLAVLRQAVRHGVERGLVALTEVAPLVDPAAVAEADERIRSSLSCDGRLCWSEVGRLRQGRLLETTRFSFPADDPLQASLAVAIATRSIFPEQTLRPETELRVDVEDFRRYLEVVNEVAKVPTGDYPRLLEVTAGIRQSSPEFVDAYLLEAELQARLYHLTREEERADAARSLLANARVIAGPSHKVLLKEIFLLLALGRIEDAEALLDRAERLAPADKGLIDRRAQLLARSGRGEEALSLYRRLLELHPTDKVLQNHARLAVQHGHVDEARATLDTLLERDPDSMRARAILAELELRSGDLDAALSLYRELAVRDDVTIAAGLALAQMLAGRTDEAVAGFETLVARFPDHPELLLNLADAQSLAGDPRAETGYRRVIEALEQQDAAWSWRTEATRAQAFAHLDQRELARRSLERMWSQAPDSSESFYAAAVVEALVGEDDAALRSARAARREGLAAHWFEVDWFRELPRPIEPDGA